MQSAATTVADYLAELPAERKTALTKLRAVIRKAAPDAVDAMRYGMPGLELDGEGLCGFASQKNYMAFYFAATEIVEAHRDELGKLSCGKSCIRFRKLEELPLETISAMVKKLAAKRRKAR